MSGDFARAPVLGGPARQSGQWNEGDQHAEEEKRRGKSGQGAEGNDKDETDDPDGDGDRADWSRHIVGGGRLYLAEGDGKGSRFRDEIDY